MICIGFQNYLFASSAAKLTMKLRSLSFKAILRQDIEFFDKDENSAGSLTSTLSDNRRRSMVWLVSRSAQSCRRYPLLLSARSSD